MKHLALRTASPGLTASTTRVDDTSSLNPAPRPDAHTASASGEPTSWRSSRTEHRNPERRYELIRELTRTSRTAVALITHATTLRDVAKLRLIAQAAGARASAAAKRLQRDGRLLDVARGQLTVTRELAAAMTVTVLAFLGLFAILGAKAFLAGRRLWLRINDDDDNDLVDISTRNWRPL